MQCFRGVVFKLWHSHIASLAALKGALLSCCIRGETGFRLRAQVFFDLRNQWKGFGPDKGTAWVLGKSAADLNLLLLVDAPLETAIILCIKLILIWTRVSNSTVMISFLKACPFSTPVWETCIRKAHLIFAGGLSTFGVSVLKHRKKLILHFWSLRQSSPCWNVRWCQHGAFHLESPLRGCECRQLLCKWYEKISSSLPS